MPTLKTRIIYSCCFGYHVLHTDKKNPCTQYNQIFFFLPQILCGSKGCDLTRAGQKMEEKYKKLSHVACGSFTK